MSMSDPIADMFTRIRNAYKAKHATVNIPASKLKQNILEVLKKEGFIGEIVKVSGADLALPYDVLKVELRYDVKGHSPLHEIRKISLPSRRVYLEKKGITPYKNGIGVKILSTSKGVISDKKARKLGVGGELLATVW